MDELTGMYVLITCGMYHGYVGQVVRYIFGEYTIQLHINHDGYDIRCANQYVNIPRHYINALNSREYHERLAMARDERQIFNTVKMPPLFAREEIKSMFEHKEWKVEKIIFNEPATIIIWKDGTKTISKCGPLDKYDPEKGVAICFMKKMLELDPNKKDRKTTANREAFNILQKAHKQYKKHRDAKIEEVFAE